MTMISAAWGAFVVFGVILVLALDLASYAIGRPTLSKVIRGWLNQDGPLPWLGAMLVALMSFACGFLLNHFLFQFGS